MRLLGATLAAALAICVLSPGNAHARFLFWPQYRSWWGDHEFRHKHEHKHAKSESTKKGQVQDAAKGSLQIIISIADQRISVYDNGALIARSSVSTGVEDHPTPLGVFSVIGKQRWHRSNIYSAAPMPYMQRITWSGIALHAGELPGYPASHGCIRLTRDFAIRLWQLTKRGTRVIIAQNDVRPVEISNPRLFAPKTETRAATLSDNIIAAATTPMPSMANAETQGGGETQNSVSAAVAPRKVVPISIFVSRRLSRLFVRQGFTPLFDAPIKIQNPLEPTGTHVFSALESQNGVANRWTVVSLPETLSHKPKTSKHSNKAREKRNIETITPVVLPEANTVLDRIEIPQDVVERISAILTPGSSLIVSDYGISDETGKDTDFIVLTH